MASQQVNRSTTSQVVEARELKILYEQENNHNHYIISYSKSDDATCYIIPNPMIEAQLYCFAMPWF